MRVRTFAVSQRFGTDITVFRSDRISEDGEAKQMDSDTVQPVLLMVTFSVQVRALKVEV